MKEKNKKIQKMKEKNKKIQKMKKILKKNKLNNRNYQNKKKTTEGIKKI